MRPTWHAWGRSSLGGRTIRKTDERRTCAAIPRDCFTGPSIDRSSSSSSISRRHHHRRPFPRQQSIVCRNMGQQHASTLITRGLLLRRDNIKIIQSLPLSRRVYVRVYVHVCLHVSVRVCVLYRLTASKCVLETKPYRCSPEAPPTFSWYSLVRWYRRSVTYGARSAGFSVFFVT